MSPPASAISSTVCSGVVRHLVRSVGRLVPSGRRQRLLFGRGNYRLDWLV